MLQDKLGLACERHTEITGYTIGAQTHTNPTSTNNFAYLTGRNFGLTKVDGHLDRAALPLIRNRQECVAPLFQPERVSQHGAQINSSVDDQVEIVRERVFTH